MDGRGEEQYVTDDSVVIKEVGEALRDFLPDVFEGLFEPGKEPEMEWVSVDIVSSRM